MVTYSFWQWSMVSLILLIIYYLGFFHLCLGSDYSTCIALGIGGWLLWTAVCIVCRRVFRNRFEYLIHLLVGLDILLEGFSPVHSGYGFYFCALAFWALFLTYHFASGASPVIVADSLQPEFADSGVVSPVAAAR